MTVIAIAGVGPQGVLPRRCRLECALVVRIREQKIGFFGRYFVEKSVFGRHREEKSEEKSIRGKIGKKIGKIADFSPKNRKKPIFPPKNRDCRARALVQEFLKKYR